ncbi:MAG TPA: hypothetical protein VFQ35_20585, partial [Polyangiaceae bacterium]|nr:hypothetical protein [Polyangiaceae bacterium]
RFTDDRARDVSENTRREVEKRLIAVNSPPEWVQCVREFVPRDEQAGGGWFDEDLPVGLVIKTI